MVKGSDFKSRLRGFVNIVGINKDNKTKKISFNLLNREKNDSNKNKIYMIRRAMALRTMLEDKAENIFEKNSKGKLMTANIDESVLKALIKVPEYKHGIRSMKAIIEMSILSNHRKFERSALPSAEQLELHVNAKEFKKYLNR